MLTAREIQEWLCLQGLLLKIDGDIGPATKAAIRSFQARNKMATTGEVDEVTATFLEHPLVAASSVAGLEAVSLAEAVVQVAIRYLGYHPREVGGQNRGPWVRHFMKGKDGDAYPWCMGSASTILQRAARVFGVNPFAYTMSCDEFARQAYNLNRLTDKPAGLAPGAVFLIRGKKDGDWVHAGIVSAFKADHFLTVEGNSNDEGSREGHEMCARIRSYRNVDFGRV